MKKIISWFKRKQKEQLTFILIPHSGKKTFSVHFSGLFLLSASLLAGFLILAFSWISLNYTNNQRKLVQKTNALEKTTANLKTLQGDITGSLDNMERVQNVLKQLSGDFKSQLEGKKRILLRESGDISSFDSIKKYNLQNIEEMSRVEDFANTLDTSFRPLKNLNRVLGKQRKLLTDLPTLWPLRQDSGIITQNFGPSINPFSSNWYLHKGLDIADPRGPVPIFAAGDGKVINVGYEPNGYGIFAMIRHKYGFASLYAHMRRTFVKKGQFVKQGDRIGLVGATGLVTGPHLHFEIRIGTELADPAQFLDMRNNQNTYGRIIQGLRYRD